MLSTLIVEDNATYRQSLHHLLEKRFPSMQIAEAADGEEALRQALSRRFDLIFMDIRLPHGNGLSLTKTIKAVFVDSLICIITNHAIFEYREAAFQNGADHFIVKGESTEAEIGDLVESWLRTRFISLIIVSDSLSRKQLAMLLSVHWPVMIVAEAVDAATGLGHTAALKPDLVLLELGLPDAPRSGSGHPCQEPSSDPHRHDRRQLACLQGNGNQLRCGPLCATRPHGPYRTGDLPGFHQTGSYASLIRLPNHIECNLNLALLPVLKIRPSFVRQTEPTRFAC